MPEYLVFRLYGPMASWGGIAVGEYRPGERSPTKSAILGLIGAALGIRRDDTTTQARLRDGYRMATIAHTPGNLLRDYHTTQVAPEIARKRNWKFATRREELSIPRDMLNTILSTREYLCDAFYTVCLWETTAEPPYPLAEIAERLKSPVFTLYLGRKSCPIALPVQSQIVTGANLQEALEKASFKDGSFLKGLPGRGAEGMLFWEGDEETGFSTGAAYATPRRDIPTDRSKWLFEERVEHEARVEIPEEVR
ncbi:MULTISPECIES: type I-E CRISPR-associated protein Cas5/CasD [unclassified Methanoculleus]|uniref:type I-E CRISPR-associated protein Cas5/CasD n=1 Tax=unclassified Methanoculleus TaxID=2619537 RepID=UPI0025DD726D|nr:MULTISPECIES: type I-E CRISPR-associated protein Cas5/CasD [unclassified Methanoculleus]